MLSLFDDRPGYSRREFLRIGALGLGGLSLPHLLDTPARAAGNKPLVTGKSVIFLYQFGGPSQLETFDPKMSAPEGIRSVTGEIKTAHPGITFNVEELRLRPDATSAVVKLVLESQPIKSLVG